jgi:hypothetical protein
MGGIGGCQTSLKTSDPIFTSWDSVVSFGTVHRVRLYWKDGKARPGSVFLAGVYQAVPLASYVYPSAPSHLLVPETSNEVDGHRAIATLSPQHTSIVIRPRRGITVQLDTTSPGQLELYVNGKRVDTMETWVYTESGALSGPFPLAQLHIKAGEKVTVKVVPIRFSGDTWRLAIADLDKY